MCSAWDVLGNRPGPYNSARLCNLSQANANFVLEIEAEFVVIPLGTIDFENGVSRLDRSVEGVDLELVGCDFDLA